MGKQIAKQESDDVADLQGVRSARAELDAILEDVKIGAEPEWEEVEVAAWGGRKFWVRGLTLAERVVLRRDGYEPAKDASGEIYYKETGNMEAVLLERCVYVDIAGRKQRLFKGDGARDLIKRQRAGVLDDLVSTALRMSGLAKQSADEAAEDFLSDPTSSPGSELPEI